MCFAKSNIEGAWDENQDSLAPSGSSVPAPKLQFLPTSYTLNRMEALVINTCQWARFRF